MKALLVLVLIAGCAETGPLQQPEDVKVWANAGSAVGVYTHLYEPVALFDGAAEPMDGTCPAIEDDGTTWTLTGDCTDNEGTSWRGSVEIVRMGERRELAFDGFGKGVPAEATLDGTATVSSSGRRHMFAVDVVHRGGVTTTIDYSGTIDGDYGVDTTWNGSGSITREGPAEPVGRVQATTVNQVLAESCSGQASSGQTMLEADGDTVVITYDGATDCDEAKAAQWALNGQDMGQIEGIACTAGRTGNAWPLAPLVVLIALRRSRRRMPRKRFTRKRFLRLTP